jgi:hypothetical protein
MVKMLQNMYPGVDTSDEPTRLSCISALRAPSGNRRKMGRTSETIVSGSEKKTMYGQM